jgi:hypothetical protein
MGQPVWLTTPRGAANFAPFAEVVELVDALRSGRSGRKPVGVRVPPSALVVPLRGSLPSIPTHRGIDAFSPGVDTAGQRPDIGEPGAPQ